MFFGKGSGRFQPSLALVTLLVSSAAFAGDAETLLVTGSSTVAPLVMAMSEEFEKLNPRAKINVQTGGSSKGVADCAKGLSDLGMLSRDLKPGEKGIEAIPIAVDGLAFVTHSGSGVSDLSPENLFKIYRGEVRNWKELGGQDVRLFAVTKAEGRGTLELFKQHFKLKSSEIKADAVVGDEAHGVKTVQSTKGAIGFVSVTTARQAVRAHQATLRVVKVGNVEPTAESIKQGTYPYSRKLQFVRCKAPSSVARAFVDFALSQRGQAIVQDSGYVPL